jgi:cyclase
MDAKRIIPVIELPDGTAGHPVELAVRLELEGADGILFRLGAPDQPGRNAGARAPWLGEVAGAVNIPFALEAPFCSWAELEGALEAGADQVVLAAPSAAPDPQLTAAVRHFGRNRVAVAVQAGWAGGQWRVAMAGEGPDWAVLDWLAELEQRGAGAILLSGPEGEGMGVAELFQGAARLALPVLFRSAGGEGLVAEALLHGADGLAFPAPSRTPGDWKTALGVHGLPLRA